MLSFLTLIQASCRVEVLFESGVSWMVIKIFLSP